MFNYGYFKERERKSQEALNLVDAINKKYHVKDASHKCATMFNN